VGADPALRARLIAGLERDRITRRRLVDEGKLFVGYAPEMERVHLENAAALDAVLAEHGWPGTALAGADGCAAAWAIAMHAIGLPALQRRALALLEEAVARGDAPPELAARLVDRIRFNEGRPQRYGTIFDWDERGALSPGPIEAAEDVDRRRAAVGLPPLAEEIARRRAAPREPGDAPPRDHAARRRELEAWRRKAGWIE